MPSLLHSILTVFQYYFSFPLHKIIYTVCVQDSLLQGKALTRARIFRYEILRYEISCLTGFVIIDIVNRPSINKKKMFIFHSMSVQSPENNAKVVKKTMNTLLKCIYSANMNKNLSTFIIYRQEHSIYRSPLTLLHVNIIYDIFLILHSSCCLKTISLCIFCMSDVLFVTLTVNKISSSRMNLANIKNKNIKDTERELNMCSLLGGSFFVCF